MFQTAISRTYSGQFRLILVSYEVGIAHLTDDRVVSSRHRVEDTIDALKRLFILNVYSIVNLVIELERSTTDAIEKE